MPRNSGGTYSLPSGNPVVAGTTIEAAWANNTLSDVGNELTNSLSRQGTGGMLAALRLADGSVTVPGLAFVSETTTGFYRAASNDMRMAILGSDVWAATSSAFTISKAVTLSVASNLGTPSALTLTNATGLPLTTGVTGTLPVANGGTGITAFGTGVATALGQNVTGSGGIVLATSPTLTTPNLGTPSAVTLTNATGLPIATGVSGLGTGVATALAVNTGSSGAFVVNGGALGTPSSGTVTNLTGTASININGTVGATTPTTGAFTTLSASSTVSGAGFSNYLASPPAIGGTAAAAGAFTTLSASGAVTLSGGTANGVLYLNGSKVATSGSALTFDGTNFATTGTASATKLIPTGGSATGNGMYLPAANTLAWSNNGAETMRLDGSGNLGIGTTSPVNYGVGYTTLAINNTTAGVLDLMAGGVSQFRLFGNALENRLQGVTNVPMTFYTNNTERARMDISGNLLVGTTAPLTGSSRKVLTLNSAAGQLSIVEFGINGTIGGYVYANASQLTLSANGASNTSPMTFETGAAERMRLDSSGNLGIGTSSPNSKLEVQASAGEISRFSTSAGYRLHIYANASGSAGSGIQSQNSDLRLSAFDSATNIRFFTGNGSTETERARITDTGNVVAGGSVALATTATDGFLYVPTCAGTPTGTPTAITGMAPIVVNTTNNKLYFYSGGAWRDAGP